MSQDQYPQQPTGPSYPPPSYQAPSSPPPTGSSLSPEMERQLVCAAHWSPIAAVLLGGLTFFGPLIVLLIGGQRSRAVRDHAVDALNFQLTVWIVTTVVFLVSIPLMLLLVGFLTIWVALLIPTAALVVHGVAAVKVAAGEDFRYPLTLHLIK